MFVQYQDCISPHQIPLAKEIRTIIGAHDFRYVYRDRLLKERESLGWGTSNDRDWMLHGGSSREVSSILLERAEIVLSGMRDIPLFEIRREKGLTTYYQSERWFKPIQTGVRVGDIELWLPGWMKMLVPSYRRMVRRFVSWANNDPKAKILAIGPWAKKDFLKMGVSADKIVEWGYFVAPSDHQKVKCKGKRVPLKILWVGRFVRLKHVDDIIRAVGYVARVCGAKVELTIVGDGPERLRLMALAKKMKAIITFKDSVPIAEVRRVMRQHDCLVFSSNSFEGWGAVVSEALEEGLNVIGTYDCGSCPTLLPKERLYHSGDWRKLADLIEKESENFLPECGIGQWTAQLAARRVVEGFTGAHD